MAIPSSESGGDTHSLHLLPFYKWARLRYFFPRTIAHTPLQDVDNEIIYICVTIGHPDQPIPCLTIMRKGNV